MGDLVAANLLLHMRGDVAAGPADDDVTPIALPDGAAERPVGRGNTLLAMTKVLDLGRRAVLLHQRAAVGVVVNRGRRGDINLLLSGGKP